MKCLSWTSTSKPAFLQKYSSCSILDHIRHISTSFSAHLLPLMCSHSSEILRQSLSWPELPVLYLARLPLSLCAGVRNTRDIPKLATISFSQKWAKKKKSSRAPFQHSDPKGTWSIMCGNERGLFYFSEAKWLKRPYRVTKLELCSNQCFTPRLLIKWWYMDVDIIEAAAEWQCLCEHQRWPMIWPATSVSTQGNMQTDCRREPEKRCLEKVKSSRKVFS